MNLILYSSLWIAVCAAAQVLLTYKLIGKSDRLDTYTLFVFASTVGLYGLHRLVGIKIVRAFEHEGRFAVIKQYKRHIIIYCIIGFIAAAGLFFFLPVMTWLYLGLPIAISAAYVLPASKSGKRLRDFSFIKIFLVASSWSLLTTTVPLLNMGYTDYTGVAIIFLERFLFIMAITIPFDIRDVEVDSGTGLSTLPHILGVTRSKILAIILLIFAGVVTFFLVAQGVYQIDIFWPYSIFVVITALLIWGTRADRSDYYYSGLLDGTMMLLYLLIITWQLVSHC